MATAHEWWDAFNTDGKNVSALALNKVEQLKHIIRSWKTWLICSSELKGVYLLFSKCPHH